jgi:hypothetical protein
MNQLHISRCQSFAYPDLLHARSYLYFQKKVKAQNNQIRSTAMFRFLVAVTFFLLFSGICMAQSGQINAAPATVVIPYGQDLGSTSISWSTQNVSAIHITVSVNNGAESLVASPDLSGNLSISWIAINNSYTFYLRANTTTGAILSSVGVSGIRPPTPTGSVSAAPQLVLIPYGQDVSSTVLSWSSSNAESIHITVSINNSSENLFASPSYSGQLTIPWIVIGNAYTFFLRANSPGGAILSQTTVTTTRPAPPSCSSISVSNGVNPSAAFITTGQFARLTANCSGTISTYNWSTTSAVSTQGSGSDVSTNSFNVPGTYTYQLNACTGQVCSQAIFITINVLPTLFVNAASLNGWDSYTVSLSGMFDNSVRVEILSANGVSLGLVDNSNIQFNQDYTSANFNIPSSALKDAINLSPLTFRVISAVQSNSVVGSASVKRSVLGFYDDYAIYMRRNITGYTNTSEANPPPQIPVANSQKWQSSVLTAQGNEHQVSNLFWGTDPSPEHHAILTCADGQKYQWYYGPLQYPLRLTKVLWTENGVTTDKTDYFLNSCSRIGSPGARFQVTATTYTIRNFFVIYPSVTYRQTLLNTASQMPPDGWDQMRYWEGQYSYSSALNNPFWLDLNSPKIRPAILLSESEWFRFRTAPVAEGAWLVGSGPIDPYTGFNVPVGVVYGTTTSYGLAAGISWTHINHVTGYTEYLTRLIPQ